LVDLHFKFVGQPPTFTAEGNFAESAHTIPALEKSYTKSVSWKACIPGTQPLVTQTPPSRERRGPVVALRTIEPECRPAPAHEGDAEAQARLRLDQRRDFVVGVMLGIAAQDLAAALVLLPSTPLTHVGAMRLAGGTALE
jgi:hypothetical protein